MVFSKNDIVIYTKTNEKVVIVDVHYDDILPYYTIQKSDKTEIQTVDKYLKKRKLSLKINNKRKKKSKKRGIHQMNKSSI